MTDDDRYDVIFAPNAVDDLIQIQDYIANTLMVPDVARHYTGEIRSQIAGLDCFPNRHPLVQDEPHFSNGVHWMPVNNFIVYYEVDEELKLVIILAVVYKRRDQLDALSEI